MAEQISLNSTGVPKNQNLPGKSEIEIQTVDGEKQPFLVMVFRSW